LERAVGFDRDDDFERAVGFERDEDFVEPLAFVERLAEPFARGAEPFDEPLLDRLRGLLEVDLLFAILILFLFGYCLPGGLATRSSRG